MEPIHPDDPRNDPRTDPATVPMCTSPDHPAHWMALGHDADGVRYWFCRIIGKPKL